MQKGDKIKIRVLEVSKEDRRLSLSIKHLEGDPWRKISENFPSGKVVNGVIIKILDKGIIFEVEGGLEGIVPLRRLKKHEKQKILSTFKEGDAHDITVQEVDAESKKIILMMDLDLGDDNQDTVDEGMVEEISKADPEKLEIPQDIIDQISDNENIDEKSSSVDTEKTAD